MKDLSCIIDTKRSSPSLLARQLRLRLVAEDDSGVPRNLHNIVVSIHAIATFQALHDYLRPRVTGLLGGGSSRISSMLSALSAFGKQASGSTDPPQSSLPPAENSSSGPSAEPTVTRRRSQRLSAKSATAAPPTTQTEASSSEASTAAPAPDPAPSETVVDSELHAEFTDDEIDAEMFDDDVDPDSSMADKTVTLSVADGKGTQLV